METACWMRTMMPCSIQLHEGLRNEIDGNSYSVGCLKIFIAVSCGQKQGATITKTSKTMKVHQVNSKSDVLRGPCSKCTKYIENKCKNSILLDATHTQPQTITSCHRRELSITSASCGKLDWLPYGNIK